MSITSLNKDYIQKSRIFLYPALGIKRGISITPIQTFVEWNGMYTANEAKFCVLYHLRDDIEFKNFEKVMLLNNKLFYDFKIMDDNKGLYIFDYESLRHNWNCFLSGKYSRMSVGHKKVIKDFYGSATPNFSYVESFLHPEKYFSIYSKLMGVNEEQLKVVGELCDKPDREKETLYITVKNLEIINQNT